MLASGDFDGNGTSEIAIFRRGAGLWSVRGLGTTYYGREGDVPVNGDYDGDGYADVSVFRPSTGLWALKDISRLYPEIISLVRASSGKLNFHDALIALVCREQGVSALVSFDRDFDELDWLSRIAQAPQVAGALDVD